MSEIKTIKQNKSQIGVLYKVDLKKNTILNIFTKAGNYRGGKSYNKDKIFTIISGKVEVITFNGVNDIKNIYLNGECIKIKANIPNLFYFIKDTEMLEWFPKNTKTRKYTRYYNLKK